MSSLHWRIREPILAIARRLFHVGVRASPHVAGKLRPLSESSGTVVLARGPREEAPPPHLWLGYAESADEFLAGGRANMESVLSLLAANGVEVPRVVLDLGCGGGRMVRFFPRSEDSEIWGADVHAEQIVWCQRNLPGINFVTVTTAPHLPFSDNQFDFVMCASVFTHNADLADAMLLEIRRILKPGGHLYLTVQDKVSVREMRTTHSDGVQPSTLAQLARLERQGRIADAEMFYFDCDPASQVFYDRDYITAKWSAWMDVVAYEECFHNWQSAMLLRKFASENATAAGGRAMS